MAYLRRIHTRYHHMNKPPSEACASFVRLLLSHLPMLMSVLPFTSIKMVGVLLGLEKRKRVKKDPMSDSEDGSAGHESMPPVASSPHPDAVHFGSNKRLKRYFRELNTTLSGIRQAQQEAPEDREERFNATLSVLERIETNLDDLTNAIQDNHRAAVTDTSCSVGNDDDADFSMGHEGLDTCRGSRSLGSDNLTGNGVGGGGSGSAHTSSASREPARQSERRKEVAKARRAALRRDWADDKKRAYWLLSGTPPFAHTETIVEAVLGAGTKMTPQVFTMLTGLFEFQVRAFMPRESMDDDEVPIQTRMRIMAGSVVRLAARSIPKEPMEERDCCLRRVRFLHTGFKSGVDLLTRHCVEYMQATKDPGFCRLIAENIDRDMATWTGRVHVQGATIPEYPQSALHLSPVKVPRWKALREFLSTGALMLAQVKIRSKREIPTSPRRAVNRRKPAAVNTEDCRRFLQGRCKNPKCRYRHRTIDAIASREVKCGDKRGVAAANPPPAAKKSKGAKASHSATAKVKTARLEKP